MPGLLKERRLLNPDFTDILSAFISEKVEFLVIGSYAMAFHGYVRATGDIDLWIKVSDKNSQRVWAALKRFGAPLLELSETDLTTPNMVIQFGVVPSRIDILTGIEGVEFDEAWVEHEVVVINELRIPIIGKSQLIKNKEASARPKDLNDVRWMTEE